MSLSLLGMLRSVSTHVIVQEGVQALVAIGNHEQFTEVVDALHQVGLLVGGHEEVLLRPQRRETNGGVPSREGVKAELVPPCGVADGLRPMKCLRRAHGHD